MSNIVSQKVHMLSISGIRVIFDKARKMKDVIRLEIGEPDFDTPTHIKEAAKRALDEGFTHYTPFTGIDELREAIAEKVKKENRIEADPYNEVVVTPGACSAIYCALLSTVNPGDKVLIPDPGWPHYEPCVKMADGIPEHYPLLERNDFRIDLNDLSKRIDKHTKAIIINSPHNPTGSVLTQEDLEGIAKIAIENDLIVISDEVYEKIIYDNATHVSIASLPDMRERTITVNAFSKTYAMTGWRVGYVIAREEIISQIAKLILYTNTCANSIAQKAALAALNGPQTCVHDFVKEFKRRRDFVVKRLNEITGITCNVPKGAFYCFPNIKKYEKTSFEFALYLLEKAKVSTVPGSSFGDSGEGYIRVSYSVSLEKLKEAMDRISEALSQKGHS
ncbi:MAG: pyridoxal phosphate-dependent aminotransferase [Candidatus Bathyarchaeia archaeon]